MTKNIFSVITGSGSYIPTNKIPNDYFKDHVFFGEDGLKLEKSNEEIILQFQSITGIEERRYVDNNLVASDIGFYAAQKAIASANIDPETIDYIIMAHNWGDIKYENRRTDILPTLASRIKHHLKIKNPNTIPYDLPFGCAGWVEGVIHAERYIKSGAARKVLVIGADTLSRVIDPHDRDSMLYSDGAGAIIIEAVESKQPVGIIAYTTESYTTELAFILRMGKSYNPNYPDNHLFLKMQGRKLYEYALKIVPQVIKASIEKAGLSLTDFDKLLIHQANTKMDDAILKRLFDLCGVKKIPENFMPMTVSFLGNSSVATVPTLYDLICKGELKNHSIKKGSNIMFVAVGAGINVNSIVYKVP